MRSALKSTTAPLRLTILLILGIAYLLFPMINDFFSLVLRLYIIQNHMGIKQVYDLLYYKEKGSKVVFRRCQFSVGVQG